MVECPICNSQQIEEIDMRECYVDFASKISRCDIWFRCRKCDCNFNADITFKCEITNIDYYNVESGNA